MSSKLLITITVLILLLTQTINGHDHHHVNNELAYKQRQDLIKELKASGEVPSWMNPERLLQGAVCQSPECIHKSKSSNASPVGLMVILCGTGTPLPNTRGRACTAIRAGDEYLVFDIGMGAELCLNSFNGTNLAVLVTKIFLTHYHSDHTGGLPNFLTFGWGARPYNIDVYGPNFALMQNFTQGMRHFYAVDALQRELNVSYVTKTCEPIFHSPKERHLSPKKYDTLLFNSKPFKAPPMDDRTRLLIYKNPSTGLRVEAFRVNHHIANPAVGYRITYKGKVVVISGDTIGYPISTAVYNAAKNADVLVHEVLNTTFINKVFATTPTQLYTDDCRIVRSHSSIEQVANVAQAANVSNLILTHIIPPPLTNRDSQNIKDQIKKVYKRFVLVGNDYDYFLLWVTQLILSLT